MVLKDCILPATSLYSAGIAENGAFQSHSMNAPRELDIQKG